jgi:ankyrin repeat protein
MLSIFLTEELERILPETENAELLFYFCSHQDEKRNTAVAILRGLVYQVIVKRPNLVKHVLSYFEAPEKVQLTLSSLEALWIIFRKLLQDPDLGTTFCVLDGLDECDEGSLRLLVAKLVDFFSSQNLQPTDRVFKLAIVSREILGLHGVAQVKLDPDHDKRVTSDIERFISVRVEELSRIEGLNEEFRTTIRTTLLECARGTFLWVGFVMNELSQKKTCTEVLETLRTLPRGLPAIYSRMLLQIESSRRRISSLILRWVTMAIRPLTLQELAAVLGIQSSAFITTEQAVRDQIAFCGPLLKVHEHEVALVHQSARDYLLREEPAGNPVLEEFRIKPEEAHLELARACFDCIEHSALQHTPLDITDASCLAESPLLLYAALHWPEHARRCSTFAKELLDLSRPFFQKESDLRRNWWETYRKREAWLKASPLPLLHMASHFGIVLWVRILLTKKTWKYSFHKLADKKDILGQSPLIYAARSGHEAVVRLLLERGADIEAKEKGRGWTALIWAAGVGHEAVMRLLLERGADVEAKEKERGGTALIWAAALGHEAVVGLLLERGADVEAKEKKIERTALIWAAGLGHEAVVGLLLERGADVEAKDKKGMTALIYAAGSGHEAVVRLLLERGADVEVKDKEIGGTALIYAAGLGYEAVVRPLLERGANVEVKDKEIGGTALIWAAVLGHEAVVRLLLEYGADVEAKDKEGETAPILAARSGHEMVARLLKSAGVS